MTGTRKRRWHRVAIPYAVVALLFLTSGVAYAWEEPDLGDPGTLSPTGTGPDGSSRLAALLAERGVTVERHTRGADAVRAARAGDATVFVPTPNLTHPLLTWILSTLPDSNRVVLVEPNQRTILVGGLPVATGFRRWAPASRPARCTDPVAAASGRATALRSGYVSFDTVDPGGDYGITSSYRCYDGGLVGLRWQGLDLVVVGASDPFRNSRIGERGNAALATGLLTAHRRVIWLDVHTAEPRSYSTFDGVRPGLDLPDNEGGEDGEDEPGGPANPLFTAFPPWVWAAAGQLAAAAVLLALWRARRLGPPVAEPLPVLVPAAETVTGRGRLYARADARGPALNAVRSAALHRLAGRLDLPHEAAEAAVVEAVAGRSGLPPEHVRSVLYGPEPADDDQLLAAVAALDALTKVLP